MGSLVKSVYNTLAAIMMFFIHLPSEDGNNSAIFVFVGAAIYITVAMILVFRAIHRNDNSYNFIIKLAVVGAVVLTVARYAVMKIYGSFDSFNMGMAEGGIAIGILVGFFGFVIVNYVLERKKGEVSLLLFTSSFLFVCALLRLWEFAGGVKKKPSFSNIMVFAKITDPFESMINQAGLLTLIGVIEFFILMGCMFFAMTLLYRSKDSIPGEWGIAMVSQILPVIGYMIFEAHAGNNWTPVNAFYVFTVVGIGDLLYLFVFLFELLDAKNEDSVVSAFSVIIGGISLRIAAILGMDLATRSLLGKSIAALSNFMTKLYNIIPFGKQTSFAGGNPALAAIGIAIVVVLSTILIFIVFHLLNKVLDYESAGKGMTEGWYRNCAMLMIIPFMVYWICSTYGNVFGEMFSVLIVMLRALVCLGFALSLSNLGPSIFEKAFWNQLKVVLISTFVSAIITCVFTVVIMHLI